MITEEQARAATLKIVSANPNHSNPECKYFYKDGTPCCLVGHVLHALGVTHEDVPPYNNQQIFDVMVKDLPQEFSPRATRYLDRIQSTLDSSSNMRWDEVRL
jgi:hypothetical protein